MKSFETAKRFIRPGLTAAVGFAAVRYINVNKELRKSERELRQENRFRQMRGEADAKRIAALRQETAANAQEAAANAQKASDMESLAMLDPLTGLYNRRALRDNFDRVQAIRKREAGGENHQYTLMILDLDNLKSINDNEDAGGHDAGDNALCAFAEAMSSSVRKEDMVARIGGDEFAIFLYHSPMDSAPRVAEQTKAQLNLDNTGLTFSGGIAQVGPDETFDECFKRADAALYQAKRLGRDRAD